VQPGCAAEQVLHGLAAVNPAIVQQHDEGAGDLAQQGAEEGRDLLALEIFLVQLAVQRTPDRAAFFLRGARRPVSTRRWHHHRAPRPAAPGSGGSSPEGIAPPEHTAHVAAQTAGDLMQGQVLFEERDHPLPAHFQHVGRPMRPHRSVVFSAVSDGRILCISREKEALSSRYLCRRLSRN
jgi:hypothetical protein